MPIPSAPGAISLARRLTSVEDVRAREIVADADGSDPRQRLNTDDIATTGPAVEQ